MKNPTVEYIDKNCIPGHQRKTNKMDFMINNHTCLVDLVMLLLDKGIINDFDCWNLLKRDVSRIKILDIHDDTKAIK